ncbi:MAG: hypothetical protein RLZZ385_2513 [Pseudomonadota bacterium]|jgi:3-dehydroquinate synthase
MQTVRVELPNRNYPIYIGPGLLDRSDLLTPIIGNSRVLIVTNETVAPLYLNRARALLSDFNTDTLELPDGEKFKTLETTSRIYDRLLEGRYDRGSLLVALGGGVIGDITGFAAATYQRGIRFIQIPTTLLAQVDSSVGGKTGVNHPLGKNMIGAFHQPECVIADTDVLKSLPARELRAGLAEVIKYGLLGDVEFFHWIAKHREGLLTLDAALVTEAVRVSCAHKARIVAADERESGVRALLNLGHTFGHAIETATGYSSWLHGEAVATGMVMAADLSMRLGWLDPRDAGLVKQVIMDFGMPVAPPADMDVEQYLHIMAADKKVMDGKLRLILLKAIGRAEIASQVDQAMIRKTLEARQQLCQA